MGQEQFRNKNAGPIFDERSTNEGLRKMKPIKSMIEKVDNVGWRATVIREAKDGKQFTETFNVRRGGPVGRGSSQLPNEVDALARGKEMALEDAEARDESGNPQIPFTAIEVKE